MYRVTIQLEHGCRVEYVEPSFLWAVERVEEYRGKMASYEIQSLEGGEDENGDQESS